METNKEGGQSNTSAVHVHNTVQFRDRPRGGCRREGTSEPYQKVVMPIERYNDNTSMEAWLTRLELYLEPDFDVEDWARETLKLLSDNSLKNISPINRFIDQPNGYASLKEKLLSGQPEARRTISLEDIFTRRQRRNETPGQYAQALKDLAGDVFRSEDQLKGIFHKGLLSSQLQAATARKLWDKNERMSFDELVYFTDTEEEAIRMSGNLLRSYQAPENKVQQHSEPTTWQNTSFHRNQQQPPFHRDQQRREREQQQFSQPFSHEQDKPRCFVCNRRGHSAKDCRENSVNQRTQQQENNKHDPQSNQRMPGSKEPLMGQVGRTHQPQSSRNGLNQGRFARQSNKKESRNEIREAPAIQGKALLNQSLVGYLCDLGADLTVINRSTFERINTPEAPILLREYLGPHIKSVGTKVKISGAICIQRCVLDQKCVVENAKMLVLEGDLPYDCIVGRDLIYRVPRMREAAENLRAVVDRCSEELISNLDEIRDTPIANRRVKKLQNAYQEGEIIIFPGFKDNSPTVVADSPEPAKTNTTHTTKSEVEYVRE